MTTALLLTRAAPSPLILAALAKVDPMRPRIIAQKEETLGSMIEIALVLMKAMPASAPKARAVIDGWLDKGAPAPEALLQRWKRGR